VILQNRGGDEVITIRDYRKLGKRSREVIGKAIRSNSFVLQVRSVEKIVIRGDELEWYLTTDEGDTVVNTRGRRNVIMMDHKVILVDPHDNISEIDLDEMDKRTLKILDRTV
ncbi:MAG: DUF1854 domain-containing protein, partial [Thaumarchaeota archaeon]|nr:DUF1854 domain-containing protein [Nitrososphaerota archaeon]